MWKSEQKQSINKVPISLKKGTHTAPRNAGVPPGGRPRTGLSPRLRGWNAWGILSTRCEHAKCAWIGVCGRPEGVAQPVKKRNNSWTDVPGAGRDGVKRAFSSASDQALGVGVVLGAFSGLVELDAVTERLEVSNDGVGEPVEPP